MTGTLTHTLGAFVASPGLEAVPKDVLPTIRNGFIDTLACLLSGRQEHVTRAALELAGQRAQLRSEPRGAFVAWWDPRQPADGRASSPGLSADDAVALGAFLDSLARELSIPAPASIPYVLDASVATARFLPPS